MPSIEAEMSGSENNRQIRAQFKLEFIGFFAAQN